MLGRGRSDLPRTAGLVALLSQALGGFSSSRTTGRLSSCWTGSCAIAVGADIRLIRKNPKVAYEPTMPLAGPRGNQYGPSGTGRPAKTPKAGSRLALTCGG